MKVHVVHLIQRVSLALREMWKGKVCVRHDVSDPDIVSRVEPNVNSQDNASLDDIFEQVEQVMTPAYRFWCRGLDIVFGIIGTGVLVLLLLVLAPLMKLDSPGPVFYYQERVGYRGKTFWILKLRSMTTNAESGGQAVWATKQDMRVTRVGRFLRATHLDELPQALNILRAEMSLIGPRPERMEYARALEEAEPLYRSRLFVKPGLTGLAQVNYGYGDTSKDELEKLRYDLYYITHQSIQLDISILLKTVVEVVGGHGI